MGAGHHHHRDSADGNTWRIAVTLALVVGYMVAEVIGGLLADSLALLADAGHMLSDAGALVVALAAMHIARRPASATHTFGYRRAEILAALANGAVLVAIAGVVAYQAVVRLSTPAEVRGPMMLAIAAGGLAVNLVGLVVLQGGKGDNLNVHGVWLHVMADALGSVGAIVSGLCVTLWGWHRADSVASLIIASLVLYSAWRLLQEAVAVLMQAVPRGVDLADVETALASVPGVAAVHDLHIWSLTRERAVMSAHLTLHGEADRGAVMSEVRRRLHDDFDVHHSTIQLDCPPECAPCP